MKEKLIIDDIRKDRIWKVCIALEKKESAESLFTSLDKFVTRKLAEKHPAFVDTIKSTDIASDTSLKRLLKPGQQGHLLYKNHPRLEKILDLYIEEYKHHWQQEQSPSPSVPTRSFSEEARNRLSKRASWICSNPDCRQLTIGPSGADRTQVYNLGTACLIYGTKAGDIRYDPNNIHEPDDIENGIWLCFNHAQLVNEHEGDYTAELLIAWKQAHEELMRACMEGRKRISFSMNQDEEEPAAAAAIIAFFDQQQILFAPGSTIPKENIITAVQDIGSWLLEQAAHILFDGRLEQLLNAIDRSCDAFLHIARTNKPDMPEYGFAALKKVIGMILNEMGTHYKIPLPANVRSIIPDNKTLH